ncbi:DMT family transporter [candidate division CSSED10-310 bacterium]|uniref:DMT family transporter n=1 Tax=candidate division CSSED10-310 bacterium TaxID=2855610 RepID=A0ABV6YRN6_UNCC1
MKLKLVGAIFICVAAMLWGLDGVVLTPRLHGLPVSFTVFILHFFPFLIMQPFLFRRYQKCRRLSWHGFGILLLVSITGGFLGTYAIVKALFLVNFNNLSVVVLLQKLQPLFAILLASLILKEKLSRNFIFLAGAALAGAYLLTFGFKTPDLAGGQALPQAAFWALIAAGCFGSATVFGKMLLRELDFKTATFARYGMTSLVTFLFLLISGTGFPFGSITIFQWAIALTIGLTTGSGAIFLYYYGLQHVEASISTICELCLPLSAFILDWIVNETVLDPAQWAGAGLLLLAITMVSLSAKDH